MTSGSISVGTSSIARLLGAIFVPFQVRIVNMPGVSQCS